MPDFGATPDAPMLRAVAELRGDIREMRGDVREMRSDVDRKLDAMRRDLDAKVDSMHDKYASRTALEALRERVSRVETEVDRDQGTWFDLLTRLSPVVAVLIMAIVAFQLRAA